MNKRSNIAPIAIFFAVMLVIHFLSSLLFNLFPFPIKPTIVHIPVIIASIIYGPRVGVTLGFLMGLLSLTVNTITILPTSYLFSPFVPNGNIYSAIIAIVPRILIGLTPYLVYKLMKPTPSLSSGESSSFLEMSSMAISKNSWQPLFLQTQLPSLSSLPF